MKITIVAGARPNFMKIAPITRAIEAARALGKSISYRLVYTGRKDDTSLDASLFSDLDMKAPDVYLGVESSNPTSLAAGIMIAFEQELTENPAHVVLVVDDLTATMSCAIVAKKTRNQGSPSGSRHTFLRHEDAEGSKPDDYRRSIRLSVYCRHGGQPKSESDRHGK